MICQLMMLKSFYRMAVEFGGDYVVEPMRIE